MSFGMFLPGIVLALSKRVPRWLLAAAMVLLSLVTLWAWPVIAVSVAAGWIAIVASSRLLERGLLLAVGVEATSFWLLSNLGNWWAFFPHDAAGLGACFLAGLPLLARALLVDSLVAGLLLHGLARRLATA